MLLALLSADAGNDVMFVTTSAGPLARRARERGLVVSVVEAPSQLKMFERTAFSGGLRPVGKLLVGLVSYNVALARALAGFRPDIIVSAAVRPTLMLGASRFRFKSPILLYAQNSIPMGLIAAFAGLLSSRICLISDGARTTFPAWFQRIAWKRFVTISSGRDFERYDRFDAVCGQGGEGECCGQSTSGEGKVHVITVSSITRRKQVDKLIEAMQTLHREGLDVVLTIVGGTVGPDSENYQVELRGLAAEADLDVNFVGWQDNVVPFLGNADLFAMASEHEGLPGVLLEAMAVGLPCITTRAGSAGQLVEECESGASVAINDQEALLYQLRRFCLDATLRQACGSAGYKAVRDRYDLTQFYDKFQTVVEGVCSTAGVVQADTGDHREGVGRGHRD